MQMKLDVIHPCCFLLIHEHHASHRLAARVRAFRWHKFGNKKAHKGWPGTAHMYWD